MGRVIAHDEAILAAFADVIDLQQQDVPGVLLEAAIDGEGVAMNGE